MGVCAVREKDELARRRPRQLHQPSRAHFLPTFPLRGERRVRPAPHGARMAMTLKSFFRSPRVQGALARVVSAYLDVALTTTRWTFENRGPVQAAADGPKGFIGCFWHGRIPLGPACREVLAHKPRKVIMSLSPDGEFIVKTMERLSFPAIRGSSSRKGDAANAKGGAGRDDGKPALPALRRLRGHHPGWTLVARRRRWRPAR